MPDNRPRPLGGNRAWIAPLVIVGVLLAVIAGALLARAPAPPPPPPAIPVRPAAELAAPNPPLTRADFVQDAIAAAGAYAAGVKPGPDRSPLIGRRFEVRLAFGCGGPGAAGPAAQASVDLDPASNSLKLMARPSVWTSLPALQDVAARPDLETIEGFWIPRPWLNGEACPQVRDAPPPATPTPPAAQTIGLARLFAKGGSRVLLRGERPYEFTRKLPKDDRGVLAHTYRLVLEGKVAGYGDGRASRCWSESIDHRPICIYAVELDRVAFQDAQTGEVLAEWRE